MCDAYELDIENASISAHIEKYFWSPVSVTLDPENRIYVTESNRHRIHVYAPSE